LAHLATAFKQALSASIQTPKEYCPCSIVDQGIITSLAHTLASFALSAEICRLLW